MVETIREHRTARGADKRNFGAVPPLSAKLKVINHLPRLMHDSFRTVSTVCHLYSADFAEFPSMVQNHTKKPTFG